MTEAYLPLGSSAATEHRARTWRATSLRTQIVVQCRLSRQMLTRVYISRRESAMLMVYCSFSAWFQVPVGY